MKKIEYIHEEEFHNEKAANEILPYIFNLLEIKSVIDIGCGLGTWLTVAKRLGKDILGIDGIKADEKIFKLNDHEFLKHNLTEEISLNKKFDLAICLEVVEHLEDDFAETIVNTITNHSDFVLFSAAIPYQTGDHHFNEQWPNYWQKLFEKKGFLPYDILRNHFWNNENIDWWYRQNIIIYSRRNDIKNLGEPTKELLSLVHPELLKMKENILLSIDIYIDQLRKPNFITSCKMLIRSILKR